MRIVFVTFDEPFFLPNFFDQILTSNSKNVTACLIHPYRKNIINSVKSLARTHSISEIAKLIAIYISRYLSSITIGKPFMSVRSVMKGRGIKVIDLGSLKEVKTKEILQKLAPDLIVSQASEIASNDLLKIPRFGWLNKHASLLPKYRGLHPLFWALYHGDSTVGVTIHKMTSTIDQGPILAQEVLNVSSNTSLFSLYTEIFSIGAHLVNRVIENPNNTGSELTPKPDKRIYKTPTKVQIREFRQKGFSFV